MNESRYKNNNGGNFASRRGGGGGGGGGGMRSSHKPPAEGTVWEGNIQRIQPYGAFCSFGPLLSGGESRGQQQQQQQYQHRERRTWQGLLHISQLSETRVEKVEDVVDVDDHVWVKVLEVEQQDATASFSNDNHRNFNEGRIQHPPRPRYRIKLSMKDVSQDGTGQDLGKEREAKEQVTTQLETNLNSMIGMGVAVDPMQRLVLKTSGNKHGKTTATSTKTTFRGGYTLVDDDEGEPEPDLPSVVADSAKSPHRIAPMGRGRGATLPAWMTTTSADGPVGVTDDPKRSRTDTGDDTTTGRDKYRDYSDDSDYSRRRSSSKHEKKRDRKRHKKKSRHRDRQRNHSHDSHSDTSDSEGSRKSDDDRRRRKRHKSSRSSHRRKKEEKFEEKKRDKKKRKHSRHRDRDYASSSRSSSPSSR